MSHEEIRALAKKYLNETGQKMVDDYLAKGKVRSAKCVILGGMDSDTIPPEEAFDAYIQLGFSSEERALIRTKNRLQ